MKTTVNTTYQEIYALIADESPNLVLITDADRSIQWANKTFLHTCGYSLDEILGKDPSMLQGKKTDKKSVKRIRTAIKNGELINERILNYTKCQTPYWIDLKIIPLKNAAGKVTNFVSIANNVNEQVEAQAKLKKSEEKLNAILNSTIDSHYLIDPQLNIIAFNKVAADAINSIWHKNLEEGNSIMDYLPKHYHKQFTKLFELALKQKVTSQVEVQLKFTSKYRVWYSLVFSPAINKLGELLGVALNATNIEKRKKAELKLIETNNKLAEIARIQSHELRKPLANIMGLSSIIQNQNPAPESKELMEKMLQSTHELDEVVHKIVNSSQEGIAIKN